MHLVLATLLGALAFFGAGASDREAVPALHSSMSTLAARVAEIATTSRAAEVETVEDRGVRLPQPVRIQVGRKVVVVPERCRDAAGRYDVVVHFHGAPVTIEPAFARADIPAVFVVLNLGIGSGPYEQAFIADGSLSSLLAEVDKIVDKHCPGKGGERHRVALSAWSAGYGAIYRVLANSADRKLVDAVLLADGLHAGFLDKHRQKLNDLQMAPFTRFAEAAARGEKLFAMTHTAIVTPGYSSAAESASYLIETLGLSRQPVHESGPRASMVRVSRANRAGFHIQGFAGNDTDAHCDHLYAIGDTLLSILKERWAAP